MDKFLNEALNEARKGISEGGIPIGSVIVHNGEILGRGHNRRVQQGSTVLHGEMDAFENAGRQTAAVYQECTLYTTLSPCAMCSGAILLYGMRSRGVDVHVVNDKDCRELMQAFIAHHPDLWNEDIGV
jgi:cytosine deaminase